MIAALATPIACHIYCDKSSNVVAGFIATLRANDPKSGEMTVVVWRELDVENMEALESQEAKGPAWRMKQIIRSPDGCHLMVVFDRI